MQPDQTQLVLYLAEDGVKAATISHLDELPTLLQELEDGTVHGLLTEIPAWASSMAQNLNRDGSRWALVAGPTRSTEEPRLSADDLAFLERLGTQHRTSTENGSLSDILMDARSKLRRMITSIDFESEDVMRNLQYVVTLFLTDNLFREQAGGSRSRDELDLGSQNLEGLEWDRVYLHFGTSFSPERIEQFRTLTDFYPDIAGVPVEFEVIEERDLADTPRHARPPGGQPGPNELLISWRGLTLARLPEHRATLYPVSCLEAVLRPRAGQLLTPDNLGRLIDRIGESRPHLVGSLFDANWTVATILSVLRDLLKEGLTLQPYTLVLEKLLEFEPTAERELISSEIRRALGAYTCNRFSNGQIVPVAVLKPTLVEKLNTHQHLDPQYASVLNERLLSCPYPLLVPQEIASKVRNLVNPGAQVIAEDELPSYLSARVVKLL